MSPVPPSTPTPTPSASPALRIQCVTLGPFETNCYVVGVEGHPACWIIDASFGPAPLIKTARSFPAGPELLILTHAHADHIAGADAVRAAFPALSTLIHADEADWLADPQANLSGLTGMPITTRPADRTLAHGDTLTLGPTTWHVLHTPGHSPGGITLHCPQAKTAIVGDSLFRASIGRTDFPGSDHDTLLHSIRERLYTLPPDTVVLPGHGPSTTIDRERRTNPFVRPL